MRKDIKSSINFVDATNFDEKKCHEISQQWRQTFVQLVFLKQPFLSNKMRENEYENVLFSKFFNRHHIWIEWYFDILLSNSPVEVSYRKLCNIIIIFSSIHMSSTQRFPDRILSNRIHRDSSFFFVNDDHSHNQYSRRFISKTTTISSPSVFSRWYV